MGSRNSEVGNWISEVGIRKREIGSGKAERKVHGAKCDGMAGVKFQVPLIPSKLCGEQASSRWCFVFDNNKNDRIP